MSKKQANNGVKDEHVSGSTVVTTTQPAQPVMSLQDLQIAMNQAITAQDWGKVKSIGAQIAGMASAEVKKEDEKFLKVREDIAAEIHALVAKYAPQLKAVKATGFIFKVDTEEMQYKAVQLLVAGSKAHSGGTGGKGGKTKDSYGMSLGEVFEKFATAEEKAEIAGKERNAANALKVKVLNRAVKEGLLKPVA
jgi:hypothetical protein